MSKKMLELFVIVLVAVFMSGCDSNEPAESVRTQSFIPSVDAIDSCLIELKKMKAEPKKAEDYLAAIDKLATVVQAEVKENPLWFESFLQEMVDLATTSSDVGLALDVRFYADDRLLKESAQLQQQLKENEAVVTSQQQEVRKFNEQLADKQVEIVRLRQQLGEQVQEVEHTNQAMAGQQKEARQLESQLAQAIKERDDLRQEAGQFANKQEELQNRITELEARIMLMRDLLRDPDLRLTGLEKYKKAIGHFRSALAELKNAMVKSQLKISDTSIELDSNQVKRYLQAVRDEVEFAINFCPEEEIFRSFADELDSISQAMGKG